MVAKKKSLEKNNRYLVILDMVSQDIRLIKLTDEQGIAFDNALLNGEEEKYLLDTFEVDLSNSVFMEVCKPRLTFTCIDVNPFRDFYIP